MSYDERPDPMYRGDTYFRDRPPVLPHITTCFPNGDNLRPSGADSTDSLRSRVEENAIEEGWRKGLNE